METQEVKVIEAKPKKNHPIKKFFLTSFFTILLVLIISGGVLGYIKREEIESKLCDKSFPEFVLEKTNISNCNLNNEQDSSNKYNVKTSENSDKNDKNLSKDSVDITAIFDLANPAVVAIGIKDPSARQEGDVIGSGFVISEDGLIATNQHVVSDINAEYFVKFSNEQDLVNVEEIFRDEVNDIAILKINRKNLPSLTLGNSDELKPGEPVIAIGNPLGELNSTVTAGIVSGLHRTVEINNGSFLRTSFSQYEDTIQTDAAINPGNSGGPLLNSKGEVIGINFATITTADNLSFAIPISYLERRVNELNDYGRFRIAYIGIEYTQELVTVRNNVYVGARVVSLDQNGSAVDLLERGDIIIEVDGKSLEDNSLSSIIQKLKIGEFVDIDVVRDGRIVTETVEIIERK